MEERQGELQEGLLRIRLNELVDIGEQFASACLQCREFLIRLLGTLDCFRRHLHELAESLIDSAISQYNVNSPVAAWSGKWCPGSRR
jgi:hypothetical protein